MKDFSQLFLTLDRTNSTTAKINAISAYFAACTDEDAVWTIALFTGRRPRRLISSTQLRQWAAEYTGLDAWMFEANYQHVGDLAETIALLIPAPAAAQETPPLSALIQQLQAAGKGDEATKKQFVTQKWSELGRNECFLFNKLLTGGFRVGVSAKLLIKGLAQAKNKDEAALIHALTGQWDAAKTTLTALLAQNATTDASKPYPFYLAYPLEQPAESLGDVEDWQIEWKWDGIRTQVIKRQDEIFIWSRGEELINEAFPDLVQAFAYLPNGTVLDGELLCMQKNIPMPFAALQQRLGRKKPGKKLLTENPAGIMAYDLLEVAGQDIRDKPLHERRKFLEQLHTQINIAAFQLSPSVQAKDWTELNDMRLGSRDQLAEGLMLKHRTSAYEMGRKKGHWWKWKTDPMHVDAVLLYAQQGHGRRATLFTDYTFAVWDNDRLVTFAKAYSGLSDQEIKEVDRFIKANTLEKFGPVRTVKPELVFEIGFEGIQVSNRHKSGIALRFPRILRWRKDKKAQEADDLNSLKRLL